MIIVYYSYMCMAVLDSC